MNRLEWYATQLRRRLPAPLRNKYIFTLTVFLVWMLFFDQFSVVSHYKLRNTLSGIEERLKFHQDESKALIEKEKTLKEEEQLEATARARFFKKNNEEIFILQE